MNSPTRRTANRNLPPGGWSAGLLSDAATQLFRSYFSIDQVPEMLGFWDRMAAELHKDLEE